MALHHWIAIGAFAGLLAFNVVVGVNSWRAKRAGARDRAAAWVDYPLVPAERRVD
jgi:hypothetical protein